MRQGEYSLPSLIPHKGDLLSRHEFLPDSVAHDTERVARFEREARVLPSLNHPDIAAIYGQEMSGDKKFLVLELVPGGTLADVIKRGAIPGEESVHIAKQICAALELAHESGAGKPSISTDNALLVRLC